MLTALVVAVASTTLVLAEIPGGNVAEEPGEPPVTRCTQPHHAAFDFWIGHWEVFTPDGTKAGENRITREEGGCLLVERWAGAQGSTGQSYNYFDNETRNWRQVWVSAGATINYEGGLNEAGEMVLEGTIGYPDGRTAPFRGTWTLLENGDVRQHFEEYSAESDTWTDWFVGLYRRMPA
jgi:hypothetical protein